MIGIFNNNLKSNEYEKFIEHNHYDAVDDFISSIDNRDEEFIDYLLTQELNIQLLTDSTKVISATELSMLYTIGLKSNTLSSYARALYTQLTGIILYPTMPIFEQVESRESKYLDVNSDLKFYPNPAQTDITISCPENAKIYISDILGKIHYQGKGSTHLSIENWDSGVYSIKMSTPNNQTTSSKFIKL